MKPGPLLEVDGLTKAFKTTQGEIKAVDGVGFDISAGETVALVGESGCGKSTVAMSLLRLIEPDAGRVSFDGVDLSHAEREALRRLRRDISIVFQNPYSSLNPKMRVWEIVGEPLIVNRAFPRRQVRERAEKHLRDVGLGAEHLNRFPHEFSGGQRQRIAIARALALEPKLLVLDEPTAALDVSVQAQVLNLLKSLQERLALSYLFISHNLATVEFISHRVLVMYLGRIVESGPVSAVFDAPHHPYTRALLDSVPYVDPAMRDRLRPPSGDVPSPLARPMGCAFAPRCPRAVPACRQTVPMLVPTNGIREAACFEPLNLEKRA
ncbi:MAG: ATP-binding cassette domain-containing protein [Proteobacteria bacterium]|nr:MAG: ATP-binding cassette domain-containing protein [Pseudomonadota bacterium]